MQTPSARDFVLQWNIGLSLREYVRDIAYG